MLRGLSTLGEKFKERSSPATRTNSAPAKSDPAGPKAGNAPADFVARSGLSTADYEFVRKLVYSHSRIDLGRNKRELVAARLGKRLRATGIPTYRAYCDFVRTPEGEGELYHLIDAISTNHTFFFRETSHFQFLLDTVLPEFKKGTFGPSERTLRVWSAACSTGEEPYSAGILISEYLAKQKELNFKIECSDISTKVLEFAARGIFEQNRLSQVKTDWQRRYFLKGERSMEGYFRVCDSLRRHFQFHHLNLFAPRYPFEQKFHLIFCRNVMIYFDRPTQEELIARLTQQLVPGGYLFIGHAESLAGVKHTLKGIKTAIFQKKA